MLKLFTLISLVGLFFGFVYSVECIYQPVNSHGNQYMECSDGFCGYNNKGWGGGIHRTQCYNNWFISRGNSGISIEEKKNSTCSKKYPGTEWRSEDDMCVCPSGNPMGRDKETRSCNPIKTVKVEEPKKKESNINRTYFDTDKNKHCDINWKETKYFPQSNNCLCDTMYDPDAYCGSVHCTRVEWNPKTFCQIHIPTTTIKSFNSLNSMIETTQQNSDTGKLYSMSIGSIIGIESSSDIKKFSNKKLRGIVKSIYEAIIANKTRMKFSESEIADLQQIRIDIEKNINDVFLEDKGCDCSNYMTIEEQINIKNIERGKACKSKCKKIKFDISKCKSKKGTLLIQNGFGIDGNYVSDKNNISCIK